MSGRARGAFEVKLTPEASPGGGDPESLGSLSIEKRFHGDLEASSRGQMLTVATAVPGSAGYVAMELVTGTLLGRKGSFALQHSGTMARGAPSLTITVVPDSGTGELSGLSGSLTITIVEGKHSYDFAYAVPEQPESPIRKEDLR